MQPRDVAGFKAVSKLYNGLMTGLVLTLVTRAGEKTARRFVFAHFRRQHLAKFLPGLTKLGLDSLPHAVACAQYHYFSNALGGVKTDYVAESDKKAWVRYPPPRWIWQGTAICAVPRSVNEAMLHGWHGHNGVSLGNPRLGFVCTGQTVEGDAGLEGYYFEYDHDLTPEERVRFAPEDAPPFYNPGAAPKLDSASWPPERLAKAERSYAMEYVRTLVPVMLELFGAEATRAHLGRTARLIGLQFYDEVAGMLGIEAHDAKSFGELLATLAEAQGETVDMQPRGEVVRVVQTGWRLMDGVPLTDPVGFESWNALWGGMLAAHNRNLRLTSVHEAGRIVWRISG